MSVLRGRPPKCDRERFITTVMNFKNNIVFDEKIVPRSNKVWKDIAISLNNDLTISSLYSMVSVNQYGILEKLGCRKETLPTEYEIDSFSENVSYSQNASKDTIDDSMNCSVGKMEFDMFISGPDFDAITTTTIYKCSQRKWNQKYKKWRVFKKGQWEDYMSKLIWHSARLSCGFNFRNHYVNLSRNAGRFDGYCKCGSIMKCSFDEIPFSKNVMAKVEVTLGSGKCGKRWLREPLRSTVCTAIQYKSVETYRADKANEYMLSGDVEPPIIPSSSVLRTAKSQHVTRNHLDPDPLKALVMMKYGGYSNYIQDIGLDPFFIHYGTNHQLQAYKRLCAAGKVCVCLDSTGSIVRKLKQPNYRIPKHIFLHAVAVNTTVGQFTVAHMLSEVSHTVALETWLKMWLRSGAPIPSQCVTDDSKALLNAAVRSFTIFPSVEDYADALKNQHKVNIYIRIDVAHFLKKYSVLLKAQPRRVKTFYLASIGQLIKCSNILDAETLMKAILVVSQSETEGILSCGRNTTCEDMKNMLKHKITGWYDKFVYFGVVDSGFHQINIEKK
ncbi:hypothetical protein JTB14_024752 [Gonioctena quinquepunctata]|nr:hypothetical protein JTB14_024752 [Gonioctena quinquepunctata]